MKQTVAYDDFAKLDIRVGLIVSASAPEWSEKLIRYEVDLGEEESQGMALMVDSIERPVMIFLPEEMELGAVIR